MNYNKVKSRYGRYASWAIWNPNDVSDTSIIEKHISDLNPNIVMIGLNVSGSIDRDWRNFHSNHRGSSDRKLMKVFNNSVYRGAYMTDFIKDVITPKSILVRKYLKKPLINKYIDEFESELECIETNNPLIIVFGADKNEFTKVFKEIFEKKYIVKNIPHYSSWGTDKEWAEKALAILNRM